MGVERASDLVDDLGLGVSEPNVDGLIGLGADHGAEFGERSGQRVGSVFIGQDQRGIGGSQKRGCFLGGETQWSGEPVGVANPYFVVGDVDLDQLIRGEWIHPDEKYDLL